MVLYKRDKTGTVFASACCVTALLNTVCSAQNGDSRVMPLQPNPPSSEENVLRYGEFDVRPHMKIGGMYDDNIFLDSSSEEDDFLWVFTPGVLLGLGDYREEKENYVYINYEPDFIVYTDNSGLNDVDHDARLKLQRRPGNWTLFLEQDFVTYSGSSVDVGNRVDEMIFTTIGNARYEISPKTSVELGAKQIIDDYDTDIPSGGMNSTNLVVEGFNIWEFEGWFDYAVTPKVKVGGGVTGGIADVRGSANQTYEQPKARVTYNLTGKLDLRASAGVEFRQIDGGKDREDLVASLGASYRPFEATSISFDAFHRNENSVRLVNQNYRSTGFALGLRQDIATIYHLYFGAGYQHLDYYATRSGVAAPRQDDYFYGRLGASWDMTDRMNLGAFYQHRNNDSNTNFDFDNNQIGLTFAYRF